jgi:hypothetical protein
MTKWQQQHAIDKKIKTEAFKENISAKKPENNHNQLAIPPSTAFQWKKKAVNGRKGIEIAEHDWNNNNDDGRQTRRINRFGSKATPDPQKKLSNHSIVQVTTYRHNNKPLKCWYAFKMRLPWSIRSFCFFYFVELKWWKSVTRESAWKILSVLFPRTSK